MTDRHEAWRKARLAEARQTLLRPEIRRDRPTLAALAERVLARFEAAAVAPTILSRTRPK